jgi:hypothetical protein
MYRANPFGWDRAALSRVLRAPTRTYQPRRPMSVISAHREDESPARQYHANPQECRRSYPDRTNDPPSPPTFSFHCPSESCPDFHGLAARRPRRKAPASAAARTKHTRFGIQSCPPVGRSGYTPCRTRGGPVPEVTRPLLMKRCPRSGSLPGRPICTTVSTYPE